MSTSNDIYETFEEYSKTSALFLDLSKVFNKVWHKGLECKLESNGIDGDALKILSSFWMIVSNEEYLII